MPKEAELLDCPRCKQRKIEKRIFRNPSYAVNRALERALEQNGLNISVEYVCQNCGYRET